VGQEGEAGIKKRKKVFKKKKGFFNFHWSKHFNYSSQKYIIMFYKLNIYINFSHLGVKLKIWWFPAFVVNRALFFITLQILLSSIRLLLLLLNFSLSFPTPFLHPFLSLPFNKFSNFQL
jgi:hypothetical protein